MLNTLTTPYYEPNNTVNNAENKFTDSILNRFI